MKLSEANREHPIHSNWGDKLPQLLPPGPELERLARTTGALCRKRGVKDAFGLLRVALCYGFCNLSLEVASVWASLSGTGKLRSEAVLKRLRKCGGFLEGVLAVLLDRRLPCLKTTAGLRIRLVDATRIASPGSKGQAWRVHAAYDPWECRLIELTLTDNTGGERLDRFKAGNGDLLVADRGYAHRRGLAHVRSTGGHFLVRTGWNRVPLQNLDGTDFDLFARLRSLKEGQTAEWTVHTAPDERHGIPAVACRLVVRKNSKEQAEQARTKTKYLARKQKNKLDPRTVEAAGYILVLTSLSKEQMGTDQVLETYRLRWQIELKFKRMKSILELDYLPAKEPRLVKAILLAKLIGTLLVEDWLSGVAKGSIFHRKQWPLTWLATQAVKLCILGKEATESWLSPKSIPLLDFGDIGRERQPETLVIAASHF